MRDLHLLDVYRDVSTDCIRRFGNVGDGMCGRFFVPSPIDRQPICIIASNGEGWDHVSVSRTKRTPNWMEMEHVKRLFFKDGECAMQLHLPPSEHMSCHPYCLHIWRQHGVEIPRPPRWMVAPEGAAELVGASE